MPNIDVSQSINSKAYQAAILSALGSCQSSFDPYVLSRDDEEYLPPNNVAETTPG